jgi:hypothetical protein
LAAEDVVAARFLADRWAFEPCADGLAPGSYVVPWFATVEDHASSHGQRLELREKARKDRERGLEKADVKRGFTSVAA